MERCYEYLGCPKIDCIMFSLPDDRHCWEIEETLCNHNGIEYIRGRTGGDKIEACIQSKCLYLTRAKNNNSV